MGRDEHYARDYFGSFPLCMWSLLLHGVFMEDMGTIITQMYSSGSVRGFFGAGLFVVFLLLAGITLMNLVMGVLVEVVSNLSKDENDTTAKRRLKQTIAEKLLKYYWTGDGKISLDEMLQVMNDEETTRTLRDLRVDKQHLVDLCLSVSEDATVGIPIGS